jgi:BirA family biotin operon repressor/biotin-[acetyl-CoA-carboxylase] ligase
MPIVKLDATSSTNDFLKELAGNQPVENFTVVTAESQTAGRGQMGAKWYSESGKNLIMSILITDVFTDVSEIFNLNICVSVAVYRALWRLHVPDIAIKWPNDIMSRNKKIGGILIENLIKSGGAISSVVGIGLNVNQNDFSGLPHASSLAIILGNEIDRDVLLDNLISEIKHTIMELRQSGPNPLWAFYKNILFRKEIPTVFESPDGQRFMGIIKDVQRDGKLVIDLEDSPGHEFGLKDIRMLLAD